MTTTEIIETLSELIDDADAQTSQNPEVRQALAPLRAAQQAALEQQRPFEVLATAQRLYIRCIVGVLEDDDLEDEWRRELASIVHHVRVESLDALERLQGEQREKMARMVASAMLGSEHASG